MTPRHKLDPTVLTYPAGYGWPARLAPRGWLRLERLRVLASAGRLAPAEACEFVKLEKAWFAERWPRWRRPDDRPERKG